MRIADIRSFPIMSRQCTNRVRVALNCTKLDAKFTNTLTLGAANEADSKARQSGTIIRFQEEACSNA